MVQGVDENLEGLRTDRRRDMSLSDICNREGLVKGVTEVNASCLVFEDMRLPGRRKFCLEHLYVQLRGR